MSSPLTLHALPLFPLGSVLFPGGHLPLRIFEVRYLDMIRKCHKTGAPFGVVSLTAGNEVQKPGVAQAGPTADAPADPAVAPVASSAKPPTGSPGAFAPESFQLIGTLAVIEEFSVPQAGFMLIRCRGMQRFRIDRQERLNYGLWVADVTHIADDVAMPIPPDLQRVADALGKVIATLQTRQVPEAQWPFRAPYQLEDCAWVANRWCELLPLPPAQKQQLMALDNPLVRLELVSDMLVNSGIVG